MLQLSIGSCMLWLRHACAWSLTQLILASHADIHHSTMTLSVSLRQGGSVSIRVMSVLVVSGRIRVVPCQVRSVSSRARVVAVSSRARVHVRRAVSCQIAACQRVHVMSAPPCIVHGKGFVFLRCFSSRKMSSLL